MTIPRGSLPFPGPESQGLVISDRASRLEHARRSLRQVADVLTMHRGTLDEIQKAAVQGAGISALFLRAAAPDLSGKLYRLEYRLLRYAEERHRSKIHAPQVQKAREEAREAWMECVRLLYAEVKGGEPCPVSS